MRSHVKASTAGSTQRQATGLGRIFRGVFATRGASLDFKGSSTPKARRAALSLALLIAAFSTALGVGTASAAAPTIVSTSSSAATTKAVVLEAQINPGGEATTYHFEYGTADCASNPCTSVPVPNGNVGSGSSAVKVTREITGLTPGTTYHYRAVATNGSGPAEGPDTTFKTYAATVLDTSCPNQAYRYGPGAFLPDCRAYEMVSPLEKNGGDIRSGEGGLSRAAYNQAAFDGNKLTYSNYTPFGDLLSARGSNQYIATRGMSEWSSHGINAPLGATVHSPLSGVSFLYDLNTQFRMFTPDLSSAWLIDANKTPLTPDAGEGRPNLYRRDNLTESYEALTIATASPAAPLAGETYAPEVQGASSDFSKVVFAVRGKLTPDANNDTNDQVYMYSGGELHLVSVLPDGTANPADSNAGFVGSNISTTDSSFPHAVSEDGSRVFWTSDAGGTGGSGVGPVYVRENPDQDQSAIIGGECTEPAKACTWQVGGGRFRAATLDGSKVLVHGGIPGGLWISDVDAKSSTLIAEGVRGVLGASDDLSFIYFTSEEVLDTGATAGEPNIYLRHEGDIDFIGTVTDNESGLVENTNAPTVDAPESLFHASRVTRDGRHLAFESALSLTSYDSTDPVTGLPAMQVYLYDADADKLTCASCNPSGARPIAKVLQVPYSASPENPAVVGKPVGGGTEIPPYRAAAWLQTAIHPNHPSRALSEDGSRLYFNAFDALVPEDTNGAQDVYQWEEQGAGSCEAPEGCISLISTGTSGKKSEFIDASADGRDVFIETSSSIDPRDPGLIDIYDARAGGGQQLPPPPPPPCIGDSCQSVPAAPNDPTPASASFKGAGDPAPRKARRSCRARNRQSGKAKKGQAKQKKAKRCKRAKRGAGR